MRVNDLISGKTDARVKWKCTTTNKHTRIVMKSSIVKERFYFRSDGDAMYNKFLDEVCKYELAGTSKHDDAPDAVTMMAEITEKRGWQW